MSDRTVTVTAGDGAPDVGELTPPDRTLTGPGPSDVHPWVLPRCEEKTPPFTAGVNPTNPLRTTFDVPNGCLSRLRSYLSTTEAVYPPH